MTAEGYSKTRWGLVVLALFLGLTIGLVVGAFFGPKALSLLTPPTPTPTSAPEPTATPIPPCYVQAEPYIEQIQGISGRWDDAVDLASSTPRVSLDGPVGQLQGIRQEAEGIEVPECAETVHGLFIIYLDKQIDVFLAFMADEPTTKLSTIAFDAHKAWSTAFGKLVGGDPPYDQ